MDTAQLYQKLLNDAIRKQVTILGRHIVLMKVRNVSGLTISDDGTVLAISGKPEDVVTRFIEEFRELSSPLVKKTMQPLLSSLSPIQSSAIPENSEKSETQTNPKL
jgi:hypothetical protein